MIIKKFSLKICLVFFVMAIMSLPLFAQLGQQKQEESGVRLGIQYYETAYNKYVLLTKDLPFLAWKRTERAEKLKDAAEDVFQKSIDVSKEYENLLRYHINDIGKQRITLLNSTVNEFFISLKKLERRHKEKFYKLEKEANISSDIRQQYMQIEQFISILQSGKINESEVSSGTLMVAATGALTAAAAFGTPAAVTAAISSFATAGTGTAISALSGAAAQSATLAWLGGGSIASGGAGVAGGAAVLTSITYLATGGVVLVGSGLTYHWYAESKLKDAIKNGDEVVKEAKNLEKSWGILEDNIRDMKEVKTRTEKLAPKAQAALRKLQRIINVFDCDNAVHAMTFKQTATAMTELLNAINAPVVGKQDNVPPAVIELKQKQKN